MVIILFSCFNYLKSQEKFDKVYGTVQDSAGKPLSFTSVVMLTPGDSTIYKHTTTSNEGKYRFKDVKKGEYILQMTYMGYRDISKKVSLKGKGKELDRGVTIMKQKSKQLEGVKVEDKKVPVKMEGDTIKYDADAYKSDPNDKVEDLLDQMPGVNVDKEGNVKAQGEDVEKVLVDGKEFFGDDPKIATKNLPADAVDEVESYNKKSDQAEFSGVDDGKRKKTLNLELKENKKSGYFGNASGGYGTGGDTKNRYKGKFNLNRFSPKTQLSFLGMANNVNKRGFSFKDYMTFMGGSDALMSGGGFRNAGNDLG
ncbi:MAG: carboxypeptidase regulatory-like domain-containing protein, partial [Flavobacteriales bacterium]